MKKKNNTKDYLYKFSKLNEEDRVKFESLAKEVTSSINNAQNKDDAAACILSIIIDLIQERRKMEEMYDKLNPYSLF